MQSDTRSKPPLWLVWLYNLALLLCLAGIVAFLARFWPSLNFFPSPDWLASLSPFVGIYLLIACWAVVWLPLVSPAGYEAFRQSKWRSLAELEQRAFRQKPSTEAPPPALGLVFVGPFILWYGLGYLLSFGFPMTMAASSAYPVAHQYTAERYFVPIRGVSRRIVLDVDNWWIDGVLRPPKEIAERIKRGDAILLSGQGNRWGVFYNEIELVKQE